MVGDAKPANGNSCVSDSADMSARDMPERAVPSIARLLGRQVAWQHFEESQAANDNKCHRPQRATSEGSVRAVGIWTCSPCLTISSQRRASRRRRDYARDLDKFGSGPALNGSTHMVAGPLKPVRRPPAGGMSLSPISDMNALSVATLGRDSGREASLTGGKDVSKNKV